MIKALKDLFDNELATYKTHYNTFDNIAEVYTASSWNVRDYNSAFYAVKRADWKASQVNEVGTDIDGNPFVRLKQPWCKGTRTVIEMIHGEPMEIEVPIDQDNYITYTKLL